jgi:hypothetical protein
VLSIGSKVLVQIGRVFGRDSEEPIPRGGLNRLGTVLFEGYPTGGEGEDMLHGAIMMVYEREGF